MNGAPVELAAPRDLGLDAGGPDDNDVIARSPRGSTLATAAPHRFRIASHDFFASHCPRFRSRSATIPRRRSRETREHCSGAVSGM